VLKECRFPQRGGLACAARDERLMARSEDLAQDVSGKLPTLEVLRSSGELGAVVSQPAAKSVQPGAERLDLTPCLGELGAVPAKAWNPE
jgi:hypothetical protein